MVTPSYAVSERAQRRNEVSQKAFLLTFFSEKSKLALQGLSPGGVLGHLLVALGLGDAVGQDVDLDLGLGAGAVSYTHLTLPTN